MKLKLPGVLGAILMLAGCGQQHAEYHGGGGTLEAINHTKWAIQFSVNGQSGIDIIGPFQGGGGGCCFGAPSTWEPGMTVRVDWETSVASASIDLPEIPGPKRPSMNNLDAETGYLIQGKYNIEYLAWREKVKKLSRQHSLTVPVPDYTGQKTCGITVHFLPCDQVKVTTSCADYGNPRHPIKEPLEMKEPKVCPK
ncbi:DUF3304 domain-containing protein [Duffyella gerundensis]|uniref:DUF3304 domain-containing protein n=1 Tax=Duffyella gerundensis TaxID=1619313 RepID=UPI001AEB45C7|nr:DUF3304 domain-containing protein [Duffyella gerundensis]QTO52843.1 DUF3304 domain-containing protein [Duffyella gerundensis]